MRTVLANNASHRLILEFAARTVCQSVRNGLQRFGRDMIRVDDWKSLSTRIEQKDRECSRLIDTLNAQEVSNKLVEQREKSEKVHELLRKNYESQESQEVRRCMQTLFVDAISQKNRNPERVPGTCEWFLENEHFIRWRGSSDRPLLWVSADPGRGKSVLSKALIDECFLGFDLAKVKVCYFFFKDNEEANRSATKALSSILHQLLDQDRSLMPTVMRKFDSVGTKLSESFYDMFQVLEEIVTNSIVGEVVVLMDAYDECHEHDREVLTRYLDNLFRKCRERYCEGQFKVLITSRPYERTNQGFTNVRDNHILIELAGNENSDKIAQEITLVIKNKVEIYAKARNLKSKVKERLQQSLLEVENKTYLWFYLVFEQLEREPPKTTETSIKQFLQNRPDSIDAAYRKILEHSKDVLKARTILTTIVGAYRPLTWEELNIATALALEEPLNDLQSEETFELVAREVCGLFVTSFEGHVFLLHQTAKE